MMLSRSSFAALALILGAALLPFGVLGAPGAVPAPVSLPALPTGPVVLSVSGAGGERHYSLAELEALGLWEVATSTFWPGDEGVYQGALLSAVLADAGYAAAKALRVTALDGFSQELPRADWTDWPLLLATRRDARPIGRRDKGPLRLIYPRDMDGALHDTLYRLRWVWLVRRIEVLAD